MADLNTIEQMARDMRGIFETVLRDSIGKAETTGACLYAAILLSSMLTKFGNAHAQVCGGGPPMDGGILDKEGVCRGHYWVEGATVAGTAFVADISADQFGYDAVVVLPLADGRKIYHPGDANLVAEHVAEELGNCEKEARSHPA